MPMFVMSGAGVQGALFQYVHTSSSRSVVRDCDIPAQEKEIDHRKSWGREENAWYAESLLMNCKLCCQTFCL